MTSEKSHDTKRPEKRKYIKIEIHYFT